MKGRFKERHTYVPSLQIHVYTNEAIHKLVHAYMENNSRV